MAKKAKKKAKSRTKKRKAGKKAAPARKKKRVAAKKSSAKKAKPKAKAAVEQALRIARSTDAICRDQLALGEAAAASPTTTPPDAPGLPIALMAS